MKWTLIAGAGLWSDTHCRKSSSMGTEDVPLFYMYSTPALDHQWLAHCPAFQDFKSTPSFERLAEVRMRMLLEKSWMRTYNPHHAKLFYIPLWEVASTWVGKCNGSTHAKRMSHAARALKNSKYFVRGRDGEAKGYNHVFVSTGCDEPLNGKLEHMQHRLGPLLGPLLANAIVGRDHACALRPHVLPRMPSMHAFNAHLPIGVTGRFSLP